MSLDMPVSNDSLRQKYPWLEGVLLGILKQMFARQPLEGVELYIDSEGYKDAEGGLLTIATFPYEDGRYKASFKFAEQLGEVSITQINGLQLLP